MSAAGLSLQFEDPASFGSRERDRNSLATSNYSYCAGIVKSWADKSLLELEGSTGQDNFELKDFLFFLHVPRTGGRFYYNCFLRHLFHKDLVCPQSYINLQFDPSEPGCKLSATHDDYSLMSMLPSGRTSVLTIMRNPVDRVLSTYEFSIEVAARSFMQRNRSPYTHIKQVGVSTLEVWPWKYLVPWMQKDLFSRHDARDLGRLVVQDNVDSYNFPSMSMPLHEYIHQPLVYDIVHNEGTFQVAGLTNNSYLEMAQEIRQCVLTYPSLGKHVLKVSKRRLDQMIYVGLTEYHEDSATMFVNMLGTEMLSHLHSSEVSIWDSHASSNKTGLTKETIQEQITVQDHKLKTSPAIENAIELKGNFTVASLIESYKECASTARDNQARRRIWSLKGIAPVNFTKEGRNRIPESTIKEIERLNSLDVELFRHAQKIFSQQRNALNEQNMISLRDLNPQDNFTSRISSYQSLSNFWLLIVCTPIFAVVFIIAARRRSSKIKL